MGQLALWTEKDEEWFRALLSAEAKRRLAWDGRERRSPVRQSTRMLVAQALDKVPAFPFVQR